MVSSDKNRNGDGPEIIKKKGGGSHFIVFNYLLFEKDILNSPQYILKYIAKLGRIWNILCM